MTTRNGVAVVVGASRGFGAALADELVATGHDVVGGARSTAGTYGFDLWPLDVSDEDSVEAFFGKLGDRTVDALVYCAGSSGGVARAWELEPDEVTSVFDVGFLGFVRCVRRVVPGMRERGTGTVLAVGSGAAEQPIDLLSAYGAAKAALEHHVRCLATELSGSGVTANVVRIAAETALAREHRDAKAEIRGRASTHPPLPLVEENLAAAMFLLSPAAQFVTGQVLQARQV